MPRNIRNFWIELDVDGRGPIAAGPVNAGGGFTLTVKMRDGKGIIRPLTVDGMADVDGALLLRVNLDGQVLTVNTAR